ncbi:putative ankyrin repeat protein [Beauveria bassiana]|nr:putative ankyrin repeat protein [Beauveria bassiana]
MATPITTSSEGASGSSTKTFRVTGVPNGWDKEKLRSFMGNYFQDVFIQSLAPRIDGGSGQATAILGDQVGNANPSGTSTIGGLTWDTDFVGMTTLFAPPQDDHKLDIIAVSGLGGHAFGSFKERGGSHMWLRDSLPYEILDKVTKRPMARVIIYGHRSDVAHSTTIQGFPDISASLLHSLRPLAAETPTTPTMFIGHSLGGILIKQALVCIAASETQHDTLGRLLRATRAIIFFAVPHSGMRIEALTEMADPSSNGPLISSLSCENSPALQTLRDEFKKLCDKKQNSLGDCRFFCFYETERSSTAAQDHTGKWRMIGPKVLAVSTVSARYCPQSESDDLCVCDIQRSHSDIVKFGQNDSEYDKVRSVLRDMAQHTILTRANVTLDERTGECLRALWFADMNKRSTEVAKAVEGTCTWVFQEPTYTRWVSVSHGLLWIKGNPGTGKSTLIKHMIQHIRRHHAKGAILATFFFHDRGTELERTRLGFYRSILHQLLQQVPDTLHEVVDKFHKSQLSQGRVGTDWYWREQDLAEHLAAAISKSHAVWLFVDALDEGGSRTANGLIEEFTALIGQSSASNGKLHVCFTCRRFPIPRITGAFELAIDRRNKPDIERYVLSGISRYPCLLQAGIADAIINGANGIFLWARLAVDEALRLKGSARTSRQIYKAIEQMPKELEELFESILTSKADEPAESLLLMQWICFAQDVMTVRQLRWAIVIDVERSGVDDPEKSLDDYFDDDAYIGDDEDMERRIVVLSCGLAEVVAGRVQFIHQAVKEFFLGQGFALLRSQADLQDRGTAVATAEHKSGHYRLARTCIRYLCMVYHLKSKAKCRCRHSADDLASPVFHFSDGLANPVIHSADDLESPGIRRNRFCYHPAARIRSPDSYWFSWRSLEDGLLTEMCVAVELDFALLEYAKRWWKIHVAASEESGTRAEDALDYSAWPPEDFICYGTRLSKYLGESQWIGLPHLAAAYQLIAQLQAIDKQAREEHFSMDVLDTFNNTPLLYAANKGKALAVQILVDSYCVDVNHKNCGGHTALCMAARRGHANVVRILLKIPGIDVDGEDAYCGTALNAAMRRRNTEVVRLLLGAADINHRDFLGATPLMSAVIESFTDMVELLLQTPGVDVNAQTPLGASALSLATQRKDIKIVRLLVESDGDDEQQRLYLRVCGERRRPNRGRD